MKKDYKKILRSLYQPRASEPCIVVVPQLKFLMVNGEGRPSERPFQLAAQTLFPVAYVTKFILKDRLPEEDYTVMPMEVKWRLDRSRNGSERFAWTMMVMQPDCIDDQIVNEAIEKLLRSKKALPFLERLRLQCFTEGLCGQIMHIGPYKGPMEDSFGILKQKLIDLGFLHEPDAHDIYFNDSRKTAPEKLRTIIRVRIWRKDEAQPESDTSFPSRPKKAMINA